MQIKAEAGKRAYFLNSNKTYAEYRRKWRKHHVFKILTGNMQNIGRNGENAYFQNFNRKY